MSDRSRSSDERRTVESDTRDELRTIAFRLREIQRLLGARIEQENRRLAEEGIDPVTGHGFFKAEDEIKVDR